MMLHILFGCAVNVFSPLSGARNNVDFVASASDFEGVTYLEGLPEFGNAIGSQGIVIYS